MSAHDEDVLKVRDIAKAVEDVLRPKSYSSERKEDYLSISKSFAEPYDGVNPSDLKWRINSLADIWKREQGTWPRSTEFLQWDVAQTSIFTYASGYSLFDYSFGIRADDGIVTYYINDPVKGISQDKSIFSAVSGLGDRAAEFIASRKVVDESDLPAILAGLTPMKQPSVGRGRAARDPLVFDERQLSMLASDEWRTALLEDPDDATVTQIVSDYLTEANAFWLREAGRLDFNTFVTDRINTTDRHKFLYEKKPEHLSDREYMSGFQQVVGQFGFGGQTALREIEAGAVSGAGLAGFGERVGRTREARLAAGGGFSRQLASQMSQMGVLG